MTRIGLAKALERISRATGYSDDEDYGVLVFIAVVTFVCLAWSAWLYPNYGVIVP